jgi:hypothetical protein
MLFPKSRFLIVALGLLGAAFSLTARIAVTDASSSSVAPTVFGQGAELHLLPLWPKRYGQHASNTAHVGSTVLAVGLGFHPGQRVRLIYTVPDANFVLQPIAQATVNAAGRFEAHFTVTRAMDRGGPYAPSGRYGGSVQPLVLEAYEGNSPGVGPRHAYAVSSLIVYSP